MANLNPSAIETAFGRWKDTLLHTNPAARGKLILRTLGRFGLRTADDLIYFLKSPAGKELETDIALEIQAEISAKEAEQLAYQEKQIHQERLLAFLLEMEIEREDAQRTQRIAETTEQQYQKSSTARSPQDKDYKDLLSSYDKAEALFINRLESQTAALAEANHKIHTLTPQKAMHEKLIANISDNALKHLEDKVIQVSQQSISLEEKINLLMGLESTEAGDMNESFTLEQLLQFYRSPEPGNLERASSWIERELKVQQIHDAFFAHNGFRHAYDEEGQLTSSVTSAAYTVPVELELVKKDNKFYLIRAGENLNDLSPDELKVARDAFKSKEPEMRTARKHRNGVEIALEDINKVLLGAKAFKIQGMSAINETETSLNELRETRAAAVQRMNKPEAQAIESDKETRNAGTPVDSRPLPKPMPGPRPLPSQRFSRVPDRFEQMMPDSTVEDVFSALFKQRAGRGMLLQNILLQGPTFARPDTAPDPFGMRPDLFKP